ncbi:mesaconyl-C4 CoA hydratase [Amycolatopsis jejuensis]|uniref:mesaconyl-C4 CoA hydratase n=1 Tax=Amycolatopsis jejuensis TaxID=330084 RepID=UPI000526E59C|nr:mesaconyl-C4 CoA hydratase [Amycolatopsis jejuensis]
MTIEHAELLLPGPAEALASLLDVPFPEDGLPLLWHWCYLLDRPAQSELGPDGHPLSSAAPAGRRRMWAGGEVRTSGVLRYGEPATRQTEVLSTVDKEGRSGPLTFVTVGHQVLQGGKVVVEERQDLVYREPGTTVLPEPGEEIPAGQGEWTIDVTPTLLFRFSALTYNAHRIHYDRDYARDVEGYPGLLTHGPLQAIVMAEAAGGRGGDQVFEYRLTAPLFDHQGMIVSADGGITAVRDKFGRQTAAGTLRSAK